LGKFLTVIFQTSKQSIEFSFLFSRSKHIMNPVYLFYWLSFFRKNVRPTYNYHLLLTSIQADNRQEWQQQNSKEEPLNSWTKRSDFSC